MPRDRKAQSEHIKELLRNNTVQEVRVLVRCVCIALSNGVEIQIGAGSGSGSLIDVEFVNLPVNAAGDH